MRQQFFFLAFDENNPEKAIGFTLIYIIFSSLALNKILILNDLCVHPNARENGVGEKLILQTVALAKELGSNLIRLRTSKSNTVAQGLYNKMGFVREDYIYSYDLIVK